MIYTDSFPQDLHRLFLKASLPVELHPCSAMETFKPRVFKF